MKIKHPPVVGVNNTNKSQNRNRKNHSVAKLWNLEFGIFLFFGI
jgi:hypothetical protein